MSSAANGKWDIDPNGVSGVVNKTADIAKGLEGEAKSYAAHLESAAGHAGTLDMGGSGGRSEGKGGAQGGLVALALSQFAEATQASLKFIGDRSGTSVQGAVDATKAYLDGDLTMASDDQRIAVQGPGAPAYHLPPQGRPQGRK